MMNEYGVGTSHLSLEIYKNMPEYRPALLGGWMASPLLWERGLG